VSIPDTDANRSVTTRRDGVAWTGLSLTAVGAATWAYEMAYQRATSSSFLAYYLQSHRLGIGNLQGLLSRGCAASLSPSH
jgi:hypothetical protein